MKALKRNSPHRLPRLIACLVVVVALGTTPVRAQTCTTSWTNAGGGDWHTAANWSAGVPDVTDEACITLDATYAVAITQPAGANSLTLGAGTDANTQTLDITAAFALGGGSSTVRSNGVFDWSADDVTLEGTVDNQGTLLISAVNPPDPFSSFAGQITGTGLLINTGTITKDSQDGSSSSVYLRVAVENAGRVEVFNGGLDFRRSSTFAASSSIEALGGRLEFEYDTINDLPTYSFADGATLTVSENGKMEVSGIIDLEGTLTLIPNGNGPSNTIDLLGQFLRVTGVGPLVVAGPGKVRTCGAGTCTFETDVVVADGGTLDLDGTGSVIAAGATLTNPAGGTVLLRRGAHAIDGTFDNQGTLLISAVNPPDPFSSFAGQITGTGLLINTGTITKDSQDGSSSSVYLRVAVENAGRVEVFNGGLDFRRSSTFAASSSIEALGGRLEFEYDTINDLPVYTFADGVSLSVSENGRMEVSGIIDLEGTLTLIPDGNGPSNSIDLLGQFLTVTGVGPLVVAGPGSVRTCGAGTCTFETDVVVADGGTLNLDGAGAVIAAGATLTNLAGGTVLLRRGSHGIEGTVDNQGTFAVALDASASLMGTGSLINSGLFRTTPGSNAYTATIDVSFTNAPGGAVSVEAETLSFAALFDHQGGAFVQGMATVDVTGATVTNDGTTAPGLSPGILSWTGDFLMGNTAGLAIEIKDDSGAGTGHDRLQVSGAAALDGALSISLLNGYGPADGQQFEVLTASSVTGSFGSVDAPAGYTAVVTYNAGSVVVTFSAAGANQPPTADAGVDQTIDCSAPSGTPVTLDGTGSSDPDGDELLFSWSKEGTDIATGPTPTVMLSYGTHLLMLTVDDGNGGTATDDVVITIDDNTAPSLTLLGDNPLLITTGTAYTEPGATATDACQGDLTAEITIDASGLDTATPGTYTVFYDVSDQAGNSAAAERIVHVGEPAPVPVITVGAAPGMFWPPNGKYKSVALSSLKLSVSDDSDPSLSSDDVVIASVWSDEPETSAGDVTLEDIVIGADCRTVELRAERLEQGNGRVYTIELAVTNAAGVTGTAVHQVSVPVGKKDVPIDDGAAAGYEVAGSCGVAGTSDAAVASTVDSPMDADAAVRLADVPAAFGLEGNYPNPFNPTTEIGFSLPEAATVRLVIYDMLGRLVARLVEGELAAGRHAARFDASHLPSGTYIYRLEAGAFSQSRAMLLVK